MVGVGLYYRGVLFQKRKQEEPIFPFIYYYENINLYICKNDKLWTLKIFTLVSI